MIAIGLIISTVAFQITSGPFSEIGIGRYSSITYGLPQETAQSVFVSNAVKLVPENASILTQNNIFPLFSNHVNAYVTPMSGYYGPGKSFLDTLTNIIEKVDFILVDSSSIDGGIVLSQPTVKENFGLLASGEGIILLERGYNENPVMYIPINETFNYQKMVPFANVTIVNDSQSINQKVLFHSMNSGPDFWYGPYVNLPPGTYQVAFRLKVPSQAQGEVMELRVGCWPSTIWATTPQDNASGYHISWKLNWTDPEEILSSTKIYGENFTTGTYQEFSLNFSVSVYGVYEFIGVGIKTPIGIYFDEARVTQISTGFKYVSDLR